MRHPQSGAAANYAIPTPASVRFVPKIARRGFCFSIGMFDKHDDVDQITERVIACAIEVHRTMGPGLLESIYKECMILECRRQGLRLEVEQIVPVDYKGTRLLSKFKVDILVERRLVIELKAVEAIRPVHKAQVISYLKLTGYPAGLLINFHEPTLKAGLHRLDHPDRYAKRRSQLEGAES